MDKKHTICKKGNLELTLNLTPRFVELYNNGKLTEVILSTKAAQQRYNEIMNK